MKESVKHLTETEVRHLLAETLQINKGMKKTIETQDENINRVHKELLNEIKERVRLTAIIKKTIKMLEIQIEEGVITKWNYHIKPKEI